jgi:hypothetical protein
MASLQARVSKTLDSMGMEGDQQGPIPSNYIQPTPNAFLSDQYQDDGTSTGGTTGGATTQNIKLYMGKQYNLNDPVQSQQYFQAISQNLSTQRDQLLREAEDAFKRGDQEAVSAYQQTLTQIDQNMADIEAEAQTYATDYMKTVRGFNEGKKGGDVSRQNTFARLSPNAFQSSQSTSQAYANDKYLEGLGDLATQADQAVGIDYINAFDPKDPSQARQVGFGANSQFGRQRNSLNTQRTGLENEFNMFRTNSQQDLEKARTGIANNFNTAVQGEAESLGAIDVGLGRNPFRYGVDYQNPYKAPQADLSQYTPYTNFQSLASPTQKGSTYQKPVYQGTNAFSQPQIDQYLNRTNTSLTSNQKNDWFTKYLQGKATA